MQFIIRYLGLIRFSHTLFALPFALLAYFMALKLNAMETPPIPFRWLDLAGILLCMVCARSAAMAFNRLADRNIDAKNPRTASRHIPGGILPAKHVCLFTAVCSVGFIASTLLFLPNSVPLFTSIPVLLFLFGYSYCKRFSVAAHFWLGTALMLVPLAAWVVVRPEFYPVPMPPILLGLAVLFWTAGFDLIYAVQDADVDKEQGLFSIPGRYGIAFAFRLSATCHVIAVFLWTCLVFVYEPFGIAFGTGIILTIMFLSWEHYLVHLPVADGQTIDLKRTNLAFFHLNVCISVGLALLGMIDIILA